MISLSSIVRAGVKRFVPGTLLFFGGALVFAASRKDMTIGPPQILGFTQLTLSMFAGYVAGLAMFRKRIARTAEVDGKRSVLAGLASTVVLLGLGVLHGSPVARWLNCTFAVVAGAGASILLFAPWMTKSARSTIRADDLDILEAAETVLADRRPLADGVKIRTPTKTPRQNSPIRAD